MRRATLLSLLVLLALGCGSDDEQDVKDALADFVATAERRDGNGVCLRLTPASRELFDRLGRVRRTDCAGVISQREGGDETASVNTFAEEADAVDVKVDGDVATAKDDGDTMRLQRIDDDWKIDLYSFVAVAYPLRVGLACGDLNEQAARAPLPAATRAAYAEDTRALAKRTEGFAKALGELKPPPGKEALHRRLRAGIDRQTRELRGLASRVAGVGGILESAERFEKRMRPVLEDLGRAQKELRVVCFSRLIAPDVAEYREKLEAACKPAAKRMANLPDPKTPEGGLRVLEEVADATTDATRRLARIDAPDPFGRAHADSVEAYERFVSEVRKQRADALRGREADLTERGELATVIGGEGFGRLGALTCAGL